jgi:tRNA G18 (ribose-2'-O)-methylase SpoU
MAFDEVAERKRAYAMMTTTMGEVVSRQLTKAEIRSGKASRQEFCKLKRNPIYLVLDSLKSAHNVGTILRLADAVGACQSRLDCPTNIGPD